MDNINILLKLIAVSFVLLLGILVVKTAPYLSGDHTSPESKCKTECAKYDMEFVRVESIHTYAATNLYCWCLKENKPYSIGAIN